MSTRLEELSIPQKRVLYCLCQANKICRMGKPFPRTDEEKEALANCIHIEFEACMLKFKKEIASEEPKVCPIMEK